MVHHILLAGFTVADNLLLCGHRTVLNPLYPKAYGQQGNRPNDFLYVARANHLAVVGQALVNELTDPVRRGDAAEFVVNPCDALVVIEFYRRGNNTAVNHAVAVDDGPAAVRNTWVNS